MKHGWETICGLVMVILTISISMSIVAFPLWALYTFCILSDGLPPVTLLQMAGGLTFVGLVGRSLQAVLQFDRT
jgi:hypothetical protein